MAMACCSVSGRLASLAIAPLASSSRPTRTSTIRRSCSITSLNSSSSSLFGVGKSIGSLPVVLGPSSQRAINTRLIIAADVQEGRKESRPKLTMGRGLGLAFGSLMFGNNANASPISRMASRIDVPEDMGLSLVSFLGDLDPGTAQLAITFVGPLITLFNLLLIFRIVMSWYPGIPVKKFPFFLAYNPTEPILGPTRKLIPPVGGVDVSPVIWVALMSFTNEILLGKQGLLVLLSQQQS